MSETQKQIDPSAFVYLSLANDPAVMAVIREAQVFMDAEGIEWQPAPTLHITLAYAPDVEHSQLLMISQALHMMQPLRIASDGIGVFENGDERAMHIQVKRHEMLEDLQRQIVTAFAFHGVELSPYSDPEMWQPHITLAYLPAGVEVPPINPGLMTFADKLIVGRGDYEAFAEITAVQIKANTEMVIAADRRHMLIITSNAYRDREGEIVSQKALQAYVESCWKDDEFVGDNPLLVWHGGEPIGEIVYAEMEGPFLVEVARELPNTVVNLARQGEEPFLIEIKSVWDALETEKDLGASHGFMVVSSDREDGVYEAIEKRETTVLPSWAAANYFTDAEIVGVSHE